MAFDGHTAAPWTATTTRSDHAALTGHDPASCPVPDHPPDGQFTLTTSPQWQVENVAAVGTESTMSSALANYRTAQPGQCTAHTPPPSTSPLQQPPSSSAGPLNQTLPQQSTANAAQSGGRTAAVQPPPQASFTPPSTAPSSATLGHTTPSHPLPHGAVTDSSRFQTPAQNASRPDFPISAPQWQ